MATMYGLARLGRDAELKYTPSGDAVASLALAFTYGKKDQAGKRPTQWVSGSLWNKRAEAMAPYLTKGQLLLVTLDDVHIREFTKGDNSIGFSLEARVTNIEFASPAPEQKQQAQSQPRAQPQQERAQARPTAAVTNAFDNFDEPPF